MMMLNYKKKKVETIYIFKYFTEQSFTNIYIKNQTIPQLYLTFNYQKQFNVRFVYQVDLSCVSVCPGDVIKKYDVV